MHLIYLSFNIFCIFEKTYVNISILLSFNMLAVNLMSLVIFHACYITPPLEWKVLWIQISPSILPFLCPSLTQFSRNWIKSFFAFFHKITVRKILSLCFSGFGLKHKFYLLLCSCTNTISGKNLVTEIWVKMLLAN